ncbi:Alpha-tocopherol transfer protein [Eumeta japonica]|uniref:Alpha-tocopherol transfer protein n=1 Tax=Eumeta variegata TaxID=151549 RepID=A0A4C1Z0Q9_EUMVA|nr:Alpha-tocopherol transfer protein [Eumeta japonica]
MDTDQPSDDFLRGSVQFESVYSPAFLGSIKPKIIKVRIKVSWSEYETLRDTNVYGLKIKGIHLINAPSFVDKVVFLFKTVLSRKLAERIHLHSSYEDFHKHVSREVLPSDYGGEERPLAELHVIASPCGPFAFGNTQCSRRAGRPSAGRLSLALGSFRLISPPLFAQWVEELSSPSLAEFCIASDRFVTDELKRIDTSPHNEEHLGILGNFRQLNVN